MTLLSNPSLQIENAWVLRLNPSTLEECRRQVANLKISLRFPAFQNEIPSVSEVSNYLRSSHHANTVQNRLQLFLLHASLLRAYGKAEQGQKLLHILYDAILQQDCPFPFRFFFERGLFYLFFNDCFSAMQDFLAASSCASNSFETLMAEMNLLITQEHLGLSTENCEANISVLLKVDYSKTFPLGLPKGLLDQWEAFRYRKSFNNGQISNLLEAATPSSLTQKSYFSIWAQALPFHRYFKSQSNLQSHIEVDSSLYLKSFRFRSLQNHLHPDDFKISKISELVDRIYLWTWRWLIEPETQGLDRILLLIDKTDLLNQVGRLSCGDHQMLQNALLWLSLFDPNSQHSFMKKVALLETRGSAQEGYPIFSLENWTIHYLIARRNGAQVQAQDYLKMLKTHPLWNSQDLLYRTLIENEDLLEENHLSGLIKNIHSLIHPPIQNKIHAEWQIDSQRYSIKNIKTGESIISESICKAMELIKNSGSVGAEEFCRVVFGLFQYDSLIHNSKIYNLLARMKSTFHSLRFSFKGGRIQAEGDWNPIILLTGGERTRVLHQSLRWKDLAESDLRSENIQSKEKNPTRISGSQSSSSGVTLTRPELDRLLGKSRSGTHRVLIQLKRKGLLKSTGKARSTRYLVDKDLFNQMKEGSV